MRVIMQKSYGFNPFRKLKITVPYANKIKTGVLRKAFLEHMKPVFDSLPKEINHWLLDNVHIRTSRRQCIGDMLVNYKKFAKLDHAHCCCQKLQRSFAKYKVKLPMVGGHVAFTGDQYEGPRKHILTQNCDNQPTPNSNRDAHVIMGNINDTLSKLPWAWRRILQDNGASQFTDVQKLNSVCQHGQTEHTCAHEKDVTRMAKDLRGACITRLDRNAGKLHVCCPVVYMQAPEKVFDMQNNDAYEVLKPKTFTDFQKGGKINLRNVEMLSERYRDGKGSEHDLIKIWGQYYHEKGWAKIAPFNHNGRLGNAYVMFKHKYWKQLHHPKCLKARPVNPMCAHPMWALFNAVGRAWMFIVNQWKADHHIMKNAQGVPTIINDAKKLFDKDATFEHHIWDVDSCYPSMPRQDIVKAMRDILEQTIAQDRRSKRKFVLVPRNKHEKPQWGTSYSEDTKATHMKIEYEDMIDVMRFSPTNAVCKLGTKIIRQTKGIPQGDSLSPAICIGTLAWYETHWMGKLTPEEKSNIKITRYLDDVFFVATSNIEHYKRN